MEGDIAYSGTPVRIYIIVRYRFGNVVYSLLISEIEEYTGDVYTYANNGTQIERVQTFMYSFLVKILKSDFVFLSPDIAKFRSKEK